MSARFEVTYHCYLTHYCLFWDERGPDGCLIQPVDGSCAGVAVLSRAHTQIFEVYFFRMYCGVVAYAALHSLVVLPVLLALLGPPPQLPPRPSNTNLSLQVAASATPLPIVYAFLALTQPHDNWRSIAFLLFLYCITCVCRWWQKAIRRLASRVLASWNHRGICVKHKRGLCRRSSAPTEIEGVSQIFKDACSSACSSHLDQTHWQPLLRNSEVRYRISFRISERTPERSSRCVPDCV